MALPFFVVAASGLGLGVADVGILLWSQTAGALTSDALWSHLGDRFGELDLLQSVGALRLIPPLGALIIIAAADGLSRLETLMAFSLLFVVIGTLVNGMTIGYLGYLMEMSPDEKRPAYSAYFNVLAAPAALLPLAGATIGDVLSLKAVFTTALLAAILQLYFYYRLSHWEQR